TLAFGSNRFPGPKSIEKQSLEDDLTVYILHYGGGKIRTVDTGISYGFFTMTNELNLLVPRSELFQCQIELFDLNSKPVPKTALGRSYGKRFQEVKPLVSSKKQSATKEMKLYLTTARPKG